ncbi:MAG TPA: TldD/PmbA family protein [Moorella mulderi]|nr:TldD/PmbA family protein [Moorella mulderi]
MKSEKEYIDLARGVVERAHAKGALAEAFLVAEESLEVEIRDQEIEALTQAQERGLGLRLIREGRLGFAFTDDFNPASLEELVEEALENSRLTTPDEYNVLPPPSQEYPDIPLWDQEIEAIPVKDKIELAMEIERQARAYDPRVKITESCSYSETRYLVVVNNSLGIEALYRGTQCGASIYLVALEGEEAQTGFGFMYNRYYRNLDPVKIGREGAQRAVRMLGARRISTRRAPVVLDPYVAVSFLEFLAPALSAEAVQKGKSLFRGKVGHQVASPALTLWDDGLIPGGIGSSPFDGEGVPTQRTPLVLKGELQGFLHNTYTAAKEGRSSTGNASRASFKSPPRIGTTNFYLEPGILSPEDIIREINEGLYLTEVMGMHTANPISGDFSLGASGIWIEKGELARPVRGVAIAGNIIEVLKNVDRVGNDLTFYGSTGSPTLRVAGLTISGS